MTTLTTIASTTSTSVSPIITGSEKPPIVPLENRNYKDQPASSASPPTRDKLRAEDKARRRMHQQNDRSSTSINSNEKLGLYFHSCYQIQNSTNQCIRYFCRFRNVFFLLLKFLDFSISRSSFIWESSLRKKVVYEPKRKLTLLNLEKVTLLEVKRLKKIGTGGLEKIEHFYLFQLITLHP